MKKTFVMLSLLVAGCSTSPQNCDVNEKDPSFLTKLTCVSSGGYRANIDKQEQQVIASQRENALAKQNLTTTTQQANQSRQQLTDEKTRLSAVRNDLSATLNQLHRQKTKSKASRQAIAELQQLQKQANSGDMSSAEVTALQKKITDAKQKVSALQQANTQQ
ncbi:hypothetical protein EFZ10_10550 [Tatumella sp. TA1]|nr:hypothetical protein EFZ10_10550 [Tatumella sp. TA1]